MDFGSSHVYAGDQSDVYYSSVPKETPSESGTVSYVAEQDPIYESIDEVRKNKPKKLLPELPQLPPEENTYDSVEEESYREPETPWDAIPKEKPTIPAKPSMYQSSHHKSRSLLAEKLRKALQDREKEMTKNSLQMKSVSQCEDEMPVAPPRRSKLKGLTSVPPPIPSRDLIKDDVFKSSIPNKEEPAQVPDSLINFDKPAATVPLLKPPPLIPKQVDVLPNAPFDPFSIPEDQTSVSLQNVLQPTLLNAAPVLNAPRVVKTLPVTTAVSSQSLSSSKASDSTNPLTDISNLKQSSSFDSTSTKPPLLPKPSNIYTRRYLYPKKTSSSTKTIATATAVNGPIDYSSTKCLYPTLPDSESLDDTSTQPTQTNMESSAPTLVREDIEFFESRLQGPSQISQSHPNPSDANSSPSVGMAQLSKPSAPQMPQSMMRCDGEKSAAAVSRVPSFDSTYTCADTNIVCVKLGILAEARSSWHCQDIPSHCEACGGIAVNAAPSQKWKCIFCDSMNKTIVPSVPSNSVQDVTYVLQPSPFPTFTNESLVVFCVDTSGSMCVSSQVDSYSGSIFVSRLKCLQQAITNQLNIIEKTNPSTRVALVTFNSEVQVFGDGSPDQKMVLSEYQLFDFDYLCHVGYQAILPGLISNTKAQLSNTVFGLNESGGTALGPALVLSTAIASKLPGSQVVVCTDGRANVGVGSLETEDDYSMCHHFYNETTMLAASRGVVVSILSIAGTDCRLVQLGKISNKTAGKVSVVEASNLSKELGNVMSDNVLATNVSINLVTQKQLFFNSKEGTVGSSIGEFIGNVTNESEVTFRYGIRRDGEFATILPPKNANFQLKIMYRAMDGALYLRVLTEQRAVTESREVAESEMNPAVIGTYASHFAAKLALQGDLDNAKHVTEAHKKLLNRGISLKYSASHANGEPQSDVIYECVMKRMTDIGKELSQIDAVSTCSSDDQSQNATLHEPDFIQEEIYDDDEVCNMNIPPVLPPRSYLDNAASKSTPKLSSSSSFESMLSKLPSMPKGSLLRKMKSKRRKEKTAMQYKDQTAQKMFNMSKATTCSFATS